MNGLGANRLGGNGREVTGWESKRWGRTRREGKDAGVGKERGFGVQGKERESLATYLPLWVLTPNQALTKGKRGDVSGGTIRQGRPVSGG